MLFTWDTTDLCIIFRSWHIRSTLSLILSLLGVAALTAGYELVREISRRYEQTGALAAVASSRDGGGGGGVLGRHGDDGTFLRGVISCVRCDLGALGKSIALRIAGGGDCGVLLIHIYRHLVLASKETYTLVNNTPPKISP